MLNSMTGFASGKGTDGHYSWTWELRAVNGKGLDLRLRVPDWIEGLEAALRAKLGKALDRGNVSVGLRVTQEDGASAATLDIPFLDQVLNAMSEIETRAMDKGLSLAPANAADVLALRGVFDTSSDETQDTSALSKALLADFEMVLAAFKDMRSNEGAALEVVLNERVEQIEGLVGQAAHAAEQRKPEIQEHFRSALVRVMDNADGIDETRVAQELATLAVKADVTEEIDRLRAHVKAARDLISGGSPVGRKLDFLSQEFNREANTLCSKAQNAALTSIGLELKTVIDQMREQVQNVE
ncbi:YicC/YloC family endoribonuclease [Roseovarius rhodophyticola]|uniref:YicC/YloC family endoribonuclease n=1 Tax=Roseovarius rhodophyticola TaxID=3080827 RepID=A0ABZ2TIF7_9RHOB|nr:YicC/YloC family endoribonuclease [Roseovarius sp. W115]